MIRTLAAALATTTCMVALAAPAAAQTHEYNIPAGSLKAALDAYVRQSGRQVVYRADEVRSARSPGVRGSLSTEVALAALLAGSGFTTRVDGNLIAIVKAGNGNAASSPASPGQASPAAGGSSSPGGSLSAGEEETVSAAAYSESAEIVVTGSRISGAGQGSSPVARITRDDIDRSGIATAYGIVQTLPQVFTGGANEEIRGTGLDAQLNANRYGATIDVRGLGSDSTLILLNGRRLPRGGGSGSFVDVSTLPASALDRVEILLDGASAIYGSDAISGVVNFILRDDFDGAETSLRYGAAQGGAEEYQASQLLGTSWNSGNALISYEYYRRERLGREERRVTRSSDLRPLGGSLFGGAFANPGFILNQFFAPIFRIPTGQDGTNLGQSDLLPVELATSNEGQDILPQQERHSAFATVRQEITPEFRLGVEGWYSRRNYNARNGGWVEALSVPVNNPFRAQLFPGQPITVGYSFIDDFGPSTIDGDVETYGAVLNASWQIDDNWQIRTYAQYARDENVFLNTNLPATELLSEVLGTNNPATAFNPAVDGFFNPFADGSNTSQRVLDFLRGEFETRSRSSTINANATLEGALVELPGGSLRFAAGAEYGRERISGASIRRSSVAEVITAAPTNRRQLTSVFAEMRLPIVGAANARRGVERLEINGALRHERYDDDVILRGLVPSRVERETTNPKIGMLWTVTDGFTFRASWGTAFRAPNLRELNTLSNRIIAASLLDPSSATGRTLALVRGGNNPDLENETATTWTFGLRLNPPAVPGLRFDIGYFEIDLTNRIANAPSTALILQQADRFAPLIVRNPTGAQIEALCSSPEFLSAPSVCQQTIGAIVDNRLSNIGTTRVRGIDAGLRYRFGLGGGSLQFASDASYLFEFSEAITPESPSMDIANTLFNQPRLKMRSSATWLQGGFTGALFWNFVNSYRDTISVPNRRVDSWNTFDLSLSYRLGEAQASGLLRGLTLGVSALNLFDSDPPFVNNGSGLIGYDPINADAIGRSVAIQMTKRW